MENVKKVICTVCPRGCHIDVTMDGREIKSIKGFTCKRGEAYARAECTAPVRTLTTTMKITGAALPRIPVKSKTPVPKEKLFDLMKAVSTATVKAPVKVGDVLLPNVCDTGVDIVASRDMSRLAQ